MFVVEQVHLNKKYYYYVSKNIKHTKYFAFIQIWYNIFKVDKYVTNAIDKSQNLNLNNGIICSF